MALKAIVGEKVAMSQVWVNDKVVPVTVLRVEPARIVQVKTTERDGYTALQVTYGQKDAKKLTKPEAGHFAKAGVQPGRRLVELRLDSVDGFEVGQEISVDMLAEGTKVDVTAVSRGKGFAGGMKRHNFAGQGASHGNHKHHRAPGSIGQCSFPGRVFKGLKMAGHMGHEQVTTLNLEVVEADPERNLVMVKGSVPGVKGAWVSVRDAVKRKLPADVPFPAGLRKANAPVAEEAQVEEAQVEENSGDAAENQHGIFPGSHGGNLRRCRIGQRIEGATRGQFARRARLADAGHVLDAKDMGTGLLKLLRHVDVVLEVVLRPPGVEQIAGVADGAFADRTAGNHRVHRHAHVVDRVQRIEDAEDVDAVLRRLLHEVLDDIVRIVGVAHRVRRTQQHLEGNVRHRRADQSAETVG